MAVDRRPSARGQGGAFPPIWNKDRRRRRSRAPPSATSRHTGSVVSGASCLCVPCRRDGDTLVAERVSELALARHRGCVVECTVCSSLWATLEVPGCRRTACFECGVIRLRAWPRGCRDCWSRLDRATRTVAGDGRRAFLWSGVPCRRFGSVTVHRVRSRLLPNDPSS